MNGTGIALPDDIGNFEEWYLTMLLCLDLYPFEVMAHKTKNDFYYWLKNHHTNQFWCDMFAIKNEWNTKLYPNLVLDKEMYPYYVPYNLNIAELLTNVMGERTFMCLTDRNNKRTFLRLKYHVTSCKYCIHCMALKKKLKYCKRCYRIKNRKVFYCSSNAEKHLGLLSLLTETFV